MSVGRWMFGSRADRERLLDMEDRVRPTRRMAFIVLGAGLVACGPWTGWWTLAPMAAAVLIYWLAERLLPHFKNPAVLLFGAWVTVEAIIAMSVALSGRLKDVTVCLLAIPLMSLNARFSARSIRAGVTLVVLAMAGVLLSSDPAGVLREPPILVAPVMLVVAWAILSTPLMRSDVEHRRGTRIDPLTGMLNRAALSGRVGDLSQQSAVSGDPVGVIHCDVDHFKAVNDLHGHAAGDAVLTDLASVLRNNVRAFEATYRLGGEEFLILLPGADLDHTRQQAERLRRAVAATILGGDHRITMSFGVSASALGDVFDFKRVFGEADQALYAAKRAGRNRVCAATDDAPLTVARAAA